MNATKYIVKIDNIYLSDFIFLWLYYEQPCEQVFQKPKTTGCSAIWIVSNNENTEKMLKKAKEKMGCELFKAN